MSMSGIRRNQEAARRALVPVMQDLARVLEDVAAQDIDALLALPGRKRPGGEHLLNMPSLVMDPVIFALVISRQIDALNLPGLMNSQATVTNISDEPFTAGGQTPVATAEITLGGQTFRSRWTTPTFAANCAVNLVNFYSFGQEEKFVFDILAAAIDVWKAIEASQQFKAFVGRCVSNPKYEEAILSGTFTRDAENMLEEAVQTTLAAICLIHLSGLALDSDEALAAYNSFVRFMPGSFLIGAVATLDNVRNAFLLPEKGSYALLHALQSAQRGAGKTFVYQTGMPCPAHYHQAGEESATVLMYKLVTARYREKCRRMPSRFR